MLSRSDEPPPTIERVELFFSPEDLVGTLLSDEIELSARNQVLHVPGDSVSARAGLKAGDVIANVEGVDTSMLSHAEITAMLKASSDQPVRKISVRSL